MANKSHLLVPHSDEEELLSQEQEKKIWTVAVVDDDSAFCSTVAMCIHTFEDFALFGTYSSSAEILVALQHDTPDIILMDIHMPIMSGIECTEIICREGYDTTVIMLTSAHQEELIFDALKAGAKGYMSKMVLPADIHKALREVADGGSPMSAMIARRFINHIQAVWGKANRAGVSSLTEQEHTILVLMAKGLPYKTISSRLNISTLTVQKHVQHIYRKLDVNNKRDAIAYYMQSKKS